MLDVGNPGDACPTGVFRAMHSEFFTRCISRHSRSVTDHSSCSDGMSGLRRSFRVRCDDQSPRGGWGGDVFEDTISFSGFQRTLNRASTTRTDGDRAGSATDRHCLQSIERHVMVRKAVMYMKTRNRSSGSDASNEPGNDWERYCRTSDWHSFCCCLGGWRCVLGELMTRQSIVLRG